MTKFRFIKDEAGNIGEVYARNKDHAIYLISKANPSGLKISEINLTQI